jgi:CubicO group peptidase (beta-lactamase class C family)
VRNLTPGSATRALAAIALLTVTGAALAQAQRASLASYEGEFAYHGSSRIVLVARDSTLFAVLDDARYPLRFLGGDRFLNGGGDTIPFRRSADGQVSGFVEHGVFFARLSPRVDPVVVTAVRARPRPLGPDGRPAPYIYRKPAETEDGLRTADVAYAGLDSATLGRIVARVVDGTYPDLHSLLVWRRGRLVAEEYFYEYDRDRAHQMRSATKSVVSALVGIAIDRGMLASDTELVTAHLPYGAFANPDPRKAQLTLRDLLTMRSGFACDDWNGDSPGNESRMYQSADWPKFVLDLPMIDAPGTKGSYCSGNVAVAGRIVELATKMPLRSFAQANLFGPLGIRDVRWNYTLASSNAATFAQVYLRPRDMLKLGILFHQHGAWNGRQVISRAWVDRSTAKWSHVGDQDYGYFWWHQWIDVATPTGTKRVDMVLATGNGGQKIYMIPSLDAVVVMTGGNYNTNSPSTAIMRRELLPAMLGLR